MINQMKKKLNKKGFTLVELIVVIAIVAVLAVIGIPAIAGQVAKAKQSAADSDARTIATQSSLAITAAEVAGKTLTEIKTAGEDKAAILAAATMPKVKAADVTITLVAIKGDDGTTDISYKVQSVEVKAGSVTGKFGASAGTPAATT